jgi:hypothetical protein
MEVQEPEGFNIEALNLDEITAVYLAPIPGQTSRSNWSVNLRAGTSALVEVLGRNQGPTKLHSCGMDHSVSRMGCAETVV